VRTIVAIALLGIAAPAAARPGYSIVLPDRVSVAERDETKVSLTIAPEPGRTISRKAPIRVSLAADPADGLDLPRKRYRRGDAADALAESPRFDLSVRFWLCGRSTCWPVATERSVPVEVTQAP